VYTVAWHAISAIDGHHTSGSFSFGIGNVTIPVQQNNNSTAYTFPSALEVAERWLNLLSDVVFLGGGFFSILVWNPTLTGARNEASNEYTRKVLSRFSRLLTLSVIVGVGATWLLLIVEAIAAAGSTSVVNVVMTAYTIVSSTRIGEYWIFRLTVVVAALAASIIIARGQKPSNRRWSVVLAIGLLLSLSTSLTSHNAAATNYYPVINLLSDWIHVTAVGAWVGGLTYFAVAITSMNSLKESKGKFLAALLRRFSSVAVVCVGVIGITGTYNLVVELGSLTALFATAYGRILLVKMAIFAPMIAFGAFNQFVLYNNTAEAATKGKRINQRRTTRWLGRFKLSIRSEMTLGVILLLVVGLLTASAPVAQTPSSAPTYQPAPTILRGYSVQGVNVTLKIFPFQAGDNHFEIDFTNQQGTSITNVRSVFVKFKYLDKNIGVSQANATASSDEGVYSLDGTYLSFSGSWQTEVWAQRSGAFDVIVPFQLNVPAISLRFSELPLSNDANPYGIVVDKSGVIWFAESGSGNLARYEPTTGTFSEFPLPQAGSRPFYLVIDNNGTVWASETQYNQIVRFGPTTNSFKQYSIPTSGAVPGGIAADNNGNIWFTEEIGDKIGRLNPLTGNITEFQIPTADSIPIQAAIGANGFVWFTESKGGKIGMVNPEGGVINEFQPQNGTLLGPTGITTIPDGSIWFTEHAGNRITRFDAKNQSFSSYAITTNQAFPFGITYHANRLWFVEHIANAIGSLDLATHIFSNFPIPNNSSDVQLLSVDQSGNVWFTLPASNVLGVLTSATSTLQLVSNSNNSDFIQLAVVAAVIVGSASIVALVLGQRRMKRKVGIR
jgi:streptogramin lyase/putative copper export protein